MLADEALVQALPAAVLAHTRTLLLVCEPDGTVRAANRPVAPRPGVPAAPGTAFADALHPDDRAAFTEHLRAVTGTPLGRAEVTVHLCTPGGDRTLDVVLTNLVDDPDVLGVLVDAADVTERCALEAALERRSLHDPLTGLANRTLLHDRLVHGLARLSRGSAPLMVAYLDLDDFKIVNDTYGHEHGDRALAALAHRLETSVRPGDTVARIGGDEFVVVCPDVADRGAADELAARLLAAVGAGAPTRPSTGSATCSLGVVLVRARVEAGEVLRAADAAMYRAKASGRGRVVHDALPARMPRA